MAQMFSYEKQNVRAVLINWAPYFVGVDVARLLWYSKPTDAIWRHCKGILETRIPSEGGIQATIVIPVSDVLRLIAKSRMKEAEKIEKWMFDEVLTKVVTTGQYVAKPKSTLEMLKEAVETLEAKEKEILRLGTTVQKQNETNVQLFEMTAMASKTGIKTIKNDLGAEINHIIFTLFGKMYPGDHRMPHLYARDLYLEKTGKTYWGAKASSLDGKKEYLSWLQTLSPQE